MREFKFTIDGKQYNAAVNELEDNFAEVTINGKTYKVELEKEEAPAAAAVRRPAAAAAPAAAAPAGLMTVKSPLPGSIVKVLVKAGQAVKKGTNLTADQVVYQHLLTGFYLEANHVLMTFGNQSFHLILREGQ